MGCICHALVARGVWRDVDRSALVFQLCTNTLHAKIPDEQKPAIGKVIAPAALFWFRYAALATVATGVLVAWMNGYIGQALTLSPPFLAIGIGMWIALVMAFNVWFIIWPNQQKALGMVEVTPEAKAAAAKLAMQTSRINTMLSIPMLFMMVAQQNGGL